MGGGGSQTVNQTFNMDVVNKSLMTTITNNQQSLSAAMNNIQKVKVVLDGMGPDCDVKVGQKINASSQSSATMSPTTINEAKTVISNELVASAAAAMEKTTEAGNLQFGDKQNMNQEVNMAIENVIENTFETNNLNEVIDEIARIDAIWSCCRRKYGENGSYLFGRFSIADCMYAAMAIRFQSYEAELSGEAYTYMQTLLDNPFVQKWITLGRREKETLSIAYSNTA